jgi:hypothetical protein
MTTAPDKAAAAHGSLRDARRLRVIKGIAAAKEAAGGAVMQNCGGDSVRCFPAMGLAMGAMEGFAVGSAAVLIIDKGLPTQIGYYLPWDDAWAAAMAIIANAPNAVQNTPAPPPAAPQVRTIGDPWRALEAGVQQALGGILARLEQCERTAQESRERATHGTVADLVSLLQKLAQTIPADLVDRLERVEAICSEMQRSTLAAR